MTHIQWMMTHNLWIIDLLLLFLEWFYALHHGNFQQYSSDINCIRLRYPLNSFQVDQSNRCSWKNNQSEAALGSSTWKPSLWKPTIATRTDGSIAFRSFIFNFFQIIIFSGHLRSSKVIRAVNSMVIVGHERSREWLFWQVFQNWPLEVTWSHSSS